MRLSDGTPLIALTLRYDRLDNFWFSLAHELSHIALHLIDNAHDSFFDNLDIDTSCDELESDADAYARNMLIPPGKWKRRLHLRSYKDIISFASKLKVHPAIIAGRIRWEQRNYKLFSRLIGNKEVRRQFSQMLLV